MPVTKKYILLIILIFLVCASIYSSEYSKETPSSVLEKNIGVSELREIDIGNTNQWISINGQDRANPVLLVIHGGPGYGMLPLLHDNNRELEDHFTVVNWDQRGAGRSYSADVPDESMTLTQFVSDGYDLTKYLKESFEKDQIYIMGHSWGTIVGMELVFQYPEDYIAFVGVGQVVDIIENEQLSHDYALNKAIEDDNSHAIMELTTIGRPDEDGVYSDEDGYDITMKWMAYYGGDLYGKQNTDEIEDYLLAHNVYAGYEDELRSGWEYSQIIFDDENVWYLDMRDEIQVVEVPVYFIAGRYDHDTPSVLVESYYNILEAPEKEIIWFENSSHFPFYSEPEKFNMVMIEKVAK